MWIQRFDASPKQLEERIRSNADRAAPKLFGGYQGKQRYMYMPIPFGLLVRKKAFYQTSNLSPYLYLFSSKKNAANGVLGVFALHPYLLVLVVFLLALVEPAWASRTLGLFTLMIHLYWNVLYNSDRRNTVTWVNSILTSHPKHN